MKAGYGTAVRPESGAADLNIRRTRNKIGSATLRPESSAVLRGNRKAIGSEVRTELRACWAAGPEVRTDLRVCWAAGSEVRAVLRIGWTIGSELSADLRIRRTIGSEVSTDLRIRRATRTEMSTYLRIGWTIRPEVRAHLRIARAIGPEVSAAMRAGWATGSELSAYVTLAWAMRSKIRAPTDLRDRGHGRRAPKALLNPALEEAGLHAVGSDRAVHDFRALVYPDVAATERRLIWRKRLRMQNCLLRHVHIVVQLRTQVNADVPVFGGVPDKSF